MCVCLCIYTSSLFILCYVEAVAPSEVRLSNYQEAASLSVQWHGVDCSSKVYVTHFIISFCQADRHNTCTGSVHSIHFLFAIKSSTEWLLNFPTESVY